VKPCSQGHGQWRSQNEAMPPTSPPPKQIA